MKKLIDDLRNERFTEREMWFYGILMPVGLVLIMAIAGWLESL